MQMPISRADYVVVGLGAWGSSTAARLAMRGHSVIGIDQFEPPHRQGSHHGNGRVIRMASQEGAFYTPMMHRAYELWRETEALSGEEILTEIGGVYVAPLDDEIVAGALEAYEGHDIPHEVLDPSEARKRFPWVSIKPNEVLVYEPGTGRLHPERAIKAHLSIAADAGADLRTNSRMVSWEEQSDGVLVQTTAGDILAQKLVLTLGAWAPDLIRLDLPLAVERQVVAIYDTSALPSTPTMFAFPSSEAESFYGLPEQGQTMKVALHHGGIIGSVEELPTEVTARDRALIASYVRERLPGLPAEPLEMMTCKYTNTPDRHFVLSTHPDHARVVIGAGCSGHGYKFASFIGEALADLAEGKDRPDLEPFSPARFSLKEASAL